MLHVDRADLLKAFREHFIKNPPPALSNGKHNMKKWADLLAEMSTSTLSDDLEIPGVAALIKQAVLEQRNVAQ